LGTDGKRGLFGVAADALTFVDQQRFVEVFGEANGFGLVLSLGASLDRFAVVKSERPAP
jgi:hypothetical protein